MFKKLHSIILIAQLVTNPFLTPKGYVNVHIVDTRPHALL
jgi:hypothetical protein